MQILKREDRRQSPRYRACQDTLLYNQDSFAEIIDISSGGVACKSHVGLGEDIEVISGVELLNCNMGMAVEGLSCRRVRQCSLLSGQSMSSGTEVVCYYAFVDLNTSQATELHTFIEICAEQQRPDVFFS